MLDDAHLAQSHVGHELLEAAPSFDRACRAPHVRVNHPNILGRPTQFARPLAQRALQPKTLLIAERLVGTGLDRRLGCRQLGMRLPTRVTARKVCEQHVSKRTGPAGIRVWSPYFERDYVPGMATDLIPPLRFQDRPFALAFARLLGQAVAVNLIVGRHDLEGRVLFDDGDEVLVEDDRGRPLEIVVADQTGTFRDYHTDLRRSAAAYAEPINRRWSWLSCPEEFVRSYLAAFVERFSSIQEEYRRNRKSFHALFADRKWDPAGSLAYRWDRVLSRLDRSDAGELAALIRAAVRPGLVAEFQGKDCGAKVAT